MLFWKWFCFSVPRYGAPWVSRPHFGFRFLCCFNLVLKLFQQLWFFQKFYWCIFVFSSLHPSFTFPCSLLSISLSLSLCLSGSKFKKDLFLLSFYHQVQFILICPVSVSDLQRASFLSPFLFISGLFCPVIFAMDVNLTVLSTCRRTYIIYFCVTV